MDAGTQLTFDQSIEEIEAGGGVNVPGWYRAVVADCCEHQRFAGALEFTFKIQNGPFKGAEVRDTLNDPDLIEDPDKIKAASNRLGLFAARLGLWDGKKGTPSQPWANAVGREVVLEITVQRWKDKTTGADKEKVGIPFAGVYPPDHPKIPDAVRKVLGLPPARPTEKGEKGTPPQAAGQTTAAKKRDYSNI